MKTETKSPGSLPRLVRRWWITLEWKLEDMWIGIFWRRYGVSYLFGKGIDVWVCLVPCCPLHIRTWRGEVTPNAKPSKPPQ